MRQPKEVIIAALQAYKGDDAARARLAFRNMQPHEMQQEYGQSGKTCAEIVAEYEAHEKEVDAAIAWIKAQ